MNVPLSQWTAPKVSRLWSAKGDDRCSPPRSDDYKDWTLMQLKREITQRQLKTNPRRRNKDAFVRVLLLNDEEQAQIQTQNAPQNQQQTLEDTSMFVPTSTADLQTIVNAASMEPAAMVPPTPAPQIPAQMQTPMAVAPAPKTLETEVEAPQGFESSKRQRVEHAEHESEGNENAHNAAASDVRRAGTLVQQIGKGSTEYLRRKLSIQAARLEIESRRLDIETKREQRNSELHAVQLALANEQLQQAKMTTQKMKNEWMVEQMIQKKRLSDAGISQEDSASLGMYLS
ncbi:hypothetical protein AM588_10011737 [Phytophthora nicotianae]|uniref:No apical meristem-associated C-terminal domain-containing protein n=1 Tax=Phytophthora nicotianae TaxID=4792 RepID=A0A0W8DLY6_PHYNI|nr:hypothetical protein AM588_10011737 [Phytophthora nicotianae]